MQRSVWPIAVLAFLITAILASAPGTGLAQNSGLTKKHHPWGTFKPGAWKLVRVIAETLDKDGTVISTSKTQTKTTLMTIDDEGVTLKIEVVVEVAGKRFEAEPKTVRQGFHGELACQDLKIGQAKEATLTIEDKKVACRHQQVECVGPTSKTVTDVYFADSTNPHILKRESVTSDLSGENLSNHATVSVVSLQMPCKVKAEVKDAALVKTVNKHSKGTIVTWAFSCPDVPGGIVEYSCKEMDADGRVLRRSTLELEEYGLEPEERPVWIGPLGRKRPVRIRKPGIFSP